MKYIRDNIKIEYNKLTNECLNDILIALEKGIQVANDFFGIKKEHEKINLKIYDSIEELHMEEFGKLKEDYLIACGNSKNVLKIVSPQNPGRVHNYNSTIKTIEKCAFDSVIETNFKETPAWLDISFVLLNMFEQDTTCSRPQIVNFYNDTYMNNSDQFYITLYLYKTYGRQKIIDIYKNPTNYNEILNKTDNELDEDILEYYDIKNNLDNDKIIETTKEYVKSKMQSENTGHDWYHIERVLSTAKSINKQEKGNEFVVEMIAILHDICDHKIYNGDEKQGIVHILKRLRVYDNINKKDLENIINSIVNLGYHKSILGETQLSLEGKVVQDADRLDATGAMLIMRTFAYTNAKGEKMYDPETGVVPVSVEEYEKTGSRTALGHFVDKGLKVKDLMNTESARKIAEHRHEYLDNFIQEFLDEWHGRK